MQENGHYRELWRMVASAGLLNRQPYYYALLTLFVLTLWTVSIAWLNTEPSFLPSLAATALFAFAFGQAALLFHDAGHGQITSSVWADRLVDIKAAILFGLSWPWWRDKHGTHHARPNRKKEDPDVGVSFLVFSKEQCAEKKGFYRFTAAYQHLLLIPLLCFEWWHLRVASVKYLLKRRDASAVWQMLLIVFHLCLYAAFWFVAFDPLKAALLMCMHTGLVSLYMGAVFTPNHIGMPVLTNEKLGYLEEQVLTSRNIHGGFLTNLIFGGLNFQIEHHLFPYAPRNMLARLQPIVQAFCKKEGIPYAKVSVLTAYRDVFQFLYRESKPLRMAKRLQG